MSDRPRLARTVSTPGTGIVHFGPGAFFRAFNAVFTDEVLTAQGGDWGICAVSLRSPTARDQLLPQGCAYTAVEKGPQGDTSRVVNAISQVLVAPADPEAVLVRMADAAVRIVSLTITEKGYCHDPASGSLDLNNPDILHDLQSTAAPLSALGFVVEALQRRRSLGIAPFTVLSCDNLPSNGALCQRLVVEFARNRDEDLADWIARNVPFPSTMVDRITPATTDGDIRDLAERAGYYDPACVVHEPFRQWVIEDNFVCGRPDWDLAGAQFVNDVAAHEIMKLRCLNGTHSALAYLGYLAGHETVSDTVNDPIFSHFSKKLWVEEILPTVPEPEGEDLSAYVAALLTRYQNPAMRHRTWQIAMDGSQKLPQRLLGTTRDALAGGRVPEGVCLAVAAWMRYVGGVDENGDPIDVRDPLAERLKAASDGAVGPEQKVAALLAFEEVFGGDLPAHSGFRAALEAAYSALAGMGARQALAAYVDQKVL